MANVIQIKRKSTTGAPTAGQLVQGELAINILDERLYSKNSSDVVFKIGLYGDDDETISGEWSFTNANTNIKGLLSAGATAGSTDYTLRTFSSGIEIADRTANNDPYIAFYEDTTYAVRNGFLQFADTGLFMRSEVHGVPVQISAEDSGGAIVNILTADPDDNTDLNGDTGIRFQLGAVTVAGFSTSGDYFYSAKPIIIKERAAAVADTATYGQLWVNSSDDHLYFTNESGTDYQISGAGGSQTPWTSNIDGAGYELTDVVIDDYMIEHQTATVSTNAVTVNLANGNSCAIDMDPATADVTLTLSGAPASGTYAEVLLVITMGTPAYDITWPGSVTWLGGGIAPNLTTTNNVVDMVHLFTVNAGTTWFGTYGTAAGSTLAGQNDVNITSPADASMLIYDTGSATWRDYIMSSHATMTDAGVVTVSIPAAQLTDINATASELNKLDISAHGVSVGWVLSADSSSVATWKASAAATELNGLSDVTLTSPASAAILVNTGGTFLDQTVGGDMSMSTSGNMTAQAAIITGKSAAGTLVSTDDFLVSDGGVLSQCNLSAIELYMQNNLTFDNLTDGTVTNAVLRWNSTNWVEETNCLIGTDGGIVAYDLELHNIGLNVTPGTDDFRAGGYGIMGDRGTFYVSNAGGGVALNYSGVHNASIKLLTTTTGVTVTGTMAATTVTGINVTSGANPGHTHTGSSISALDASDITTGTLAVLRGGTGVTTKTGTGNVVLSAGPTLTGSIIVSGTSMRFNDNVELYLGTSNDFGMRFNAANAEFFSNVGSFDLLMTDVDLDMNDNDIIQAVLVDYAIESASYTPSGTTQTLTYSNGPAFEVDLESVTGNITITLSGGPPSGTYGQITVKVTQDTINSRTITWAGGTFEWAGGTAHVMTTTKNAWSIYTFETWDSGTTWFGGGADYE